MPRTKSNAKTHWLSRILSLSGRKTATKRRITANRLRLEKLESRQLLAAVLLDIPGVNGDTAAAGATNTDIQLSGFEWGFGRDASGPKAKITDPITVRDLEFTKPNDSASNDLFAQANFAPINSKVAKLRIVDDVGIGKNLFSFDLTSSRLTSFCAASSGAGQNRQESGALSFSKIDLIESTTATNRTASWNLLTGGATSSTIVGPGNIDPAFNPLNIETVLEIGGQKLLVNGFDWNAERSGRARGATFTIDRGIDVGTAGLLGSAAKGTLFSKVTISDRKEIDGVNRIVMEWNLYDAFISDFDLSVTNQGAATNSLGWSYSKIEVKVTEHNSKVVASKPITTTWDEAANIVASDAINFGTVEPAIDELVQVSFLDFVNVGKIQYQSLDWSLTKPVTIGATTNTIEATNLGSLQVKLPAGSSTPELLNKFASGGIFATVKATQIDGVDKTSALDNWTISPSSDFRGDGSNFITIDAFSISSKGLDDPQVNFDLNVPKVAEEYNDRKIPLITGGNFDEIPQTSTGTLSFGERTVDTEFELVVREVGKTSEIP